MMNGKKFLDGLQLENELITDQEIKSIAAVERDGFVAKGDLRLPLEKKSSDGEFIRQRFLVTGFKQSRSQLAMHLYAETDHVLH
jgi:hypothetical protein